VTQLRQDRDTTEAGSLLTPHGTIFSPGCQGRKEVHNSTTTAVKNTTTAVKIGQTLFVEGHEALPCTDTTKTLKHLEMAAKFGLNKKTL